MGVPAAISYSRFMVLQFCNLGAAHLNDNGAVNMHTGKRAKKDQRMIFRFHKLILRWKYQLQRIVCASYKEKEWC